MSELLEVYIPTSAFRDRKLKVLEALVKYLKEQQQLNYSQIGRLLNRNPRTIWTAYQKAKRRNATTPRTGT